MNQVDRKQADRRELHFDSIDEILAEAERLASAEVTTTGNHSHGQIVEHLARTLDVVTGQITGVKVPLPVRMVLRVIRPWFLANPMRPGFNLNANTESILWPDGEVSVEDAMAHFRESLQRFREAKTFPKHPLLGNMGREQHDQLQCRHCELHLSFIHPVDELDAAQQPHD